MTTPDLVKLHLKLAELESNPDAEPEHIDAVRRAIVVKERQVKSAAREAQAERQRERDLADDGPCWTDELRASALGALAAVERERDGQAAR